jgi:hypothetical protein
VTAPPKDTALIVAKAYIARGWNPVPVAFKGKSPTLGKGWQNVRITEANVADYFNSGDQNVGVQLGANSSGLTDVDLDCPEALKVAPYLMPITKALFGRSGKRASHMLYRTNLAASIDTGAVQFQDPNKKADHNKKVMLLEVRVGGGGKGAQTVFPGSVHETGETIEWEHGCDSDPLEIDGEVLLRAARETAVASLIARAWPNVGVRHDTALALGGFLARCGMPIARIVLFAEAVAVAVGADRTDTKRCAKDAAESYAKGARAYGLPHLKEMLDEKTAEKCAEWLGYAPDGADPEQTAPSEPATPVDLWGVFAAPALPRGLLPRTIEQFALAQGEIMGVDPAGLAIAALVVCAATIPDHVMLQPKKYDRSWTESARIWVALIGRPGERKSPIINQASRPLVRIDHRMFEQYLEAMARYDALPPDERKTTRPPRQVRLCLEDTTMEAAQEVFLCSPSGLLLLQDELGGWFGSMDKYSGGRSARKDRGFWLQTFNGGAYAVNRVGRGSSYITNLSACMLGGIQPDVIRKVSDETVDDGLLQRLFPIVLLPATMGKDAPATAEVARYEELVERLHESFPEGKVLLFDDGALAVREELERKHLDLTQCSAVNKKLAAHIDKYNGLFARLCVLWHCVEHVEQPIDLFAPDARPVLSGIVSEGTVRRVAKFLHDFLLPHAVAFYGGMLGLSDEHDRLQAVAGYILARGLQKITNRDVYHGDRTMRALKKRDIEDIFAQLDALGWIDRIPSTRINSPSHWRVNPECHRLFQDRAKKEAERRKGAREMIAALLGGGGGGA